MNALRTECIERAVAEIQDCLVVGAGINGAVAAAALTGRVAKVTVIDKGDFSSCTSQESSNLAWGGIKYLENYEFKLVWNLCKSRNRLLDAYPNQVKEIRFFTCIAKGFRKSHVLIYLGAILYWFMGRCKTRFPRVLSRRVIQREAPMVKTASLAGGLEYSDCYFVENDARFVFGFIRKVLKQGHCAINYMELLSAEWKEELWCCTLRDHAVGGTVKLRARSIVNAAGPFVDILNERFGVQSPFRHLFSKGVHIIVPQIIEVKRVLTFFASDGRLFFMAPMGGKTCIGTTDTPTDSETAEPSDDDLDFLISNANTLLKLDRPLIKEDIISTRCGVRPLVIRRGVEVGLRDWTALSRRHEVAIHTDRKLCSIYGGKLTDCLNVGEEVADAVISFGLQKGGAPERWYGEPSSDERRQFEAKSKELGLNTGFYKHLWRRYGSDAFGCLEKIEEDSGMAERVIGQYTRAELHLMAEREMIIHLEDFLRRRTQLALTEPRDTMCKESGLQEACRILFGEQSESEYNRFFGLHD